MTAPHPPERAPRPEPDDLPPNGEIRVAVVLYGGVSLAIYMSGVCEELLRLVRATADKPAPLSPLERIYRDLAAETTPPGGRSRVVIDLIAGASAGGINGVALAKALAVGAPDMQPLRKAWIEDIDIDRMLSDRAMTDPGSLLDGGYVYDRLRHCLGRITGRTDIARQDLLDLFVTATNLGGRKVRIQLTGKAIREWVHRDVFHFARDIHAERDDFGDTEPRGGAGDGLAARDAMLAFAARCTSAFPLAFRPMAIEDLPPADRQAVASRIALNLGHPVAPNEEFADGGYLDNRPFGHVIGMFPLRPPRLPGRRKLIFIDPFPETEGETSGEGGRVSFLRNIALAVSTLPRKETIREDLRAVGDWNRQLSRLSELQKRQQRDAARLGETPAETAPRPDLETQDLADIVASSGFGECYATYHHLRVYAATDNLAALIGQMAGFAPESDETVYLRHFIRAWRERTFSAYKGEGKVLENIFLRDYDFEFQRRRLVHLMTHVNRLQDSPEDIDLPLLRAHVLEALDQLRVFLRPRQGATDDFLDRETMLDLTTRLQSRFDEVMGKPSHDARYEAAQKVYKDPVLRGYIDTGMNAISRRFRGLADGWNRRIRAVLPEGSDLRRLYEGFHRHDVRTFAVLDGIPSEEHAEVDVVRISPEDSTIRSDPDKLAGTAYAAFGGFLSREWRRHDMLWGRLDAVEGIVQAMLPDAPEPLRKAYRTRLHDAILAEEFQGELGVQRWTAMVKARGADAGLDQARLDAMVRNAFSLGPPKHPAIETFAGQHAQVMPEPPPPAQLVSLAGRSARILSRMVEALRVPPAFGPVRRRAARALRLLGILLFQIVSLTTPSGMTFGLRPVLSLLVATGLVTAGLSIFLAGFDLAHGLGLAGAALLALLLVTILGNRLNRRAPAPPRITAILLTILLAMGLLAAMAVFLPPAAPGCDGPDASGPRCGADPG